MQWTLTVLVGQLRLNVDTVALMSWACEWMNNTQRKQHNIEHDKYTLNITHNERNTLRNQRNTQGTQHSINTTKQTHNTQWAQRTTTTPNYNKFTISCMTHLHLHCQSGSNKSYLAFLDYSCKPIVMSDDVIVLWRYHISNNTFKYLHHAYI